MDTPSLFDQWALAIVCLFMFFATPALGQDWQETANVPPGLVYRPASPEVLQGLANKLISTLRASSKETLSDTLVTVGPGLWRTLVTTKLPPSPATSPGLDSIPCEFKPGGTGRLFKSDRDLKEIDRLLQLLTSQWDSSGTSIVLRNPTKEELIDFWSVISFDINEPLIVAQIGSHQLLFYFNKQKLSWIDEFPINLQK